MIDAMQFDMTLILTEKVDSMDGYRLIQSVCDWREENLEVIEDAENKFRLWQSAQLRGLRTSGGYRYDNHR